MKIHLTAVIKARGIPFGSIGSSSEYGKRDQKRRSLRIV